MDGQRFDRIAVALARPATRRGLLFGSLGALIAAIANPGGRRARADWECGPVGPNDNGTLCGAECVNIYKDERHCGYCYHQCPWNAHCENMECVCDSGLFCNEICINPLTDYLNCGGCNNGCPVDAVCDTGVCVCGGGLTNCNVECVDLSSDPANCGGCGNACPFNAHCSVGQCVCDAGLYCDGICVNIWTDRNHCGGCNIACPAGAVCADGNCICADGTYCNGECVDTLTDRNNCGWCNNVCPYNASCVDGACACETGIYCDSICVNPFTDKNHCGDCNSPCPFNATCIDATCICNDGIFCDGICINPSSDNTHCGACGLACAINDACCDGLCRDLATDPEHCGACGVACDEDEICDRGECIGGECREDETRCGDACVDLQTDPDHCGACNTACEPGEQCTDGRCVPATAEKIDAWPLWSGKTRLRGAHLYQRLTTDADDPAIWGQGVAGPRYAAKDLSRLATLGANVVTISFPAIVGSEPPFPVDAALRDHLTGLVDAALAAGLWSVIALRTGPGRTEADLLGHDLCVAGGCFGPAAEEEEGPTPAPLWSDDDAQMGWIAAWQSLAEHFRTHPGVIGYEVMALPDPPALDRWQRFAQDLVDAIRDVDDATPIIVTAPGTPEEALAQRLVTGDAIVQGIAALQPARYLAQPPDATSLLSYPGRFIDDLDGASGVFDQSWVMAQLDPIASFEREQRMPVAISSFGVSRYQLGAADFLTDQMDAFEQAGLNHTLWAWYPEAWPAENDAFDIRRGPDPENHRLVKNDLRAAVASHWSKNSDRPQPAEGAGEVTPIV